MHTDTVNNIIICATVIVVVAIIATVVSAGAYNHRMAIEGCVARGGSWTAVTGVGGNPVRFGCLRDE